ncbi:acetyltransferase [Candidatus Omnitrophota bacterium]
MLKKIILFPFGGNTRESLLSILAINRIEEQWKIMGFIDDNPLTWGKDCSGIKVLGGREILKKFPDAQILAAPGNPDSYLKRKDIIESLDIADSSFATIIHPTVTVSNDSTIGHNTILMPNVVISCGVKIGKHCIILPNTVISHDSVIGDYCCIGSNVTVSGNVTIAPESYIGSGVKIRENITIGKKSLVGLGSNVISNIEEGVIAAGNPAKVMRKAI